MRTSSRYHRSLAATATSPRLALPGKKGWRDRPGRYSGRGVRLQRPPSFGAHPTGHGGWTPSGQVISAAATLSSQIGLCLRSIHGIARQRTGWCRHPRCPSATEYHHAPAGGEPHPEYWANYILLRMLQLNAETARDTSHQPLGALRVLHRNPAIWVSTTSGPPSGRLTLSPAYRAATELHFVRNKNSPPAGRYIDSRTERDGADQDRCKILQTMTVD